jgi:ABC-2 type transport system ATP-binding protein
VTATSAIRLNHLSKRYGSSRGIDDVSFEVAPGEVFGFLGPNGAGKTTALRTLVGLIKATSGSAEILGQPVSPASVQLRSRIGYLPGVLSTYKGYTSLQYLQFIARIRGVDCGPTIVNYAARLQLDLNRKISELSKGNRQKVGVIQAFMHHPDVLLLDEPTSGLDPIAQREFEAILDEAKTRGAAVILSSHVLSEVEHLADRVAIINEGKILIVAKISTLKENSPRTIDLYFKDSVDGSIFSSVPGIKNLEVQKTRVSCTLIGSEAPLLTAALENGLVSVRTHEPSLEDIFVSLVQNEGQS